MMPKAYLRQRKHPISRPAGAAPTSPDPASRMGSVVADQTFPLPSALGTPCASCPPITGQTAPPGHCTNAGEGA